MKRWMLVGGLVLSAALWWWLKWRGFSAEICWTSAVTLLCGLWWMSEAIPIPATSLIPLAVLPFVGVLTPGQVAGAYGNQLILLLLGGFMLSTALQRSGAHRRIALTMVRLFGGRSGRRLVFGFMTAAAGLSMWLSNAATVLMLVPIAMAVLDQTESRRLKVALLLGIAYAASIGGIGTPIGTPPNLVFMQVYSESTNMPPPTFLQWMMWALPIVLIMLPIAGCWLTRGLPNDEHITVPDVGEWRAEEIRTLLVFGVTAVAWITRQQPYGGWSEALGLQTANDASVALLSVIVMFLIPNGKGERLLDWQTASGIEWGIFVLFAGGIAIARAFTESGLAATLGNSLSEIGSLPVVVMLAVICLAVTFMTEVTSNTATTTLLMPILAAAALSAQLDPKLIMVPAAISASFAFMLPVATAPNAIVFSSNELTVKDMAREGFILNLLGVVVVAGVCLLRFG
ncbi:MAG: SLC13 family permease [Planctomycetota bacterium]